MKASLNPYIIVIQSSYGGNSVLNFDQVQVLIMTRFKPGGTTGVNKYQIKIQYLTVGVLALALAALLINNKLNKSIN